MCVIHHNRKRAMYVLRVYAEDVNGKTSLLSPKEIQSQLDIICKNDTEAESNPSIFTTMDRDEWADVRLLLYTIFVKC